MDLVTDTMASLGDIFSSLGSSLGDGVDGVVTLLTPDSVVQLIFILLGILLATYLTLCALYHGIRGLYTFTLPWLLSKVSKPKLKEKYGPWAVVTGSTQGIGREYALALAKQGLNVVLISRNKQELENVSNEIKDLHKVDTATIVADFSEAGDIGKIVKKVKGLNHEIGVVVNNVGMMGPGYNMLGDMDKKVVKELLTVNMLPVTMFCHAFLPDMAKRGKGAVINISSVAGLVPVPFLAVYSATQHYISAFTQAIAQEYQGSGVVIQEVDPCQVDNASNKCLISCTSMLAPSPAAYVNSAVKTIGYNNRTCGYWLHSLMMTLLLNMTPTVFSSLVIWCCSKSQYKATVSNNNNNVVANGKKSPPPPQQPPQPAAAQQQQAKPAPTPAVQEKK